MTDTIHNPHRIAARVIADSVSPTGVRITTMEWDMPKSLLAQVNTYGMLSSVAGSGRAIPTRKLIYQTEADPFLVPTWRYRAPEGGMVPGDVASPQDAAKADEIVEEMLQNVLAGMRKLEALKLAKEDLRYLEPWEYTTVVITGTEWDNYFTQRLGHDAQGTHQILARAAKAAMDVSTPIERPYIKPGYGPHGQGNGDAHLSWHLPYITDEERRTVAGLWLPRMSAVRVSRVSYGHQGEPRTLEDELDRFKQLVENKHMSPLNQPAMVVDQIPPCPMFYDNVSPLEAWHGNLRGWKPIRKFVGGESGSLTHGTQRSVWPWGEMRADLLEGLT